MIDELIYKGLTLPPLDDLLLGDDGVWRVWPAGSLGFNGVPTEPEFPYVQHGEGGSSRVQLIKQGRKVWSAFWDVFVYDAPGSYLRIKTILDQAQDNLEGMTGRVSSDGWRATEILQTNVSSDSLDVVTKQLTKRATFRVVASRDS